MAKFFASDSAMEITTDAVQIMGGDGYSKEFGVEKSFLVDAKNQEEAEELIDEQIRQRIIILDNFDIEAVVIENTLQGVKE